MPLPGAQMLASAEARPQVWVVDIRRFERAPLRMAPQGIMPAARAVVVMAIHHPDAAGPLLLPRRPTTPIGRRRIISLPHRRADGPHLLRVP